jgi:predicted ATP-binding protein involved in virulence
MKIVKIEVKKLFGVFDHEIPLNTKEHITIIHGPNGYGKTILLTILEEIFSSRYNMIQSIPFSEFFVYFDDKSSICLKKKDAFEEEKRKKSKNGEPLMIEWNSPRSKQKIFNPIDLEFRNLSFPLSMFEELVPGLERVGPTNLMYLPTREVLSLNQVLERFGHRLPFPIQDMKIEKEPSWLKKIKSSVNINFIKTERLSSKNIDREPFEHRRSSTPIMVPAVNKYSEELSEAIQSKLAEYGSLSQKLDRTFPIRVLEEKHSNYPSEDEFKEELKLLEKKRSKVIDAGFLDKEKEIDFKSQKIDESNINVLSIYLDDVKNKLKVFDELTEKIDLLVKVINSRFLYKKLSISKTDGFVFKTADGKILPPISLSSGEQHELVILYEMLFKVKAGSLILIDEPELSLHVAWQQQFLEDLQQITKLVGFDVLIATHSPQIINERWDLTVELKGPKL